MSGATKTIDATGNQDIDGVLIGIGWASNSVTYSFPTDASQYGPYITGPNEATSFQPVSTAVANEARWTLGQYAADSQLHFTELTTSQGSANIRIGTSAAPPSSWTYYPSTYFVGGDVWYGTSDQQPGNPSDGTPVKGGYSWYVVIHELGHSLGLKHGQETGGPGNTAMTDGHDQMEYSVMSYNSYAGDTNLHLTNEQFGYAQTPMMYDIAGIQAMYGANFSGPANTVYSWSPTTGQEFINGVGQGLPGANRVFMTVWDGGGHATYDFSAYSTNLSIDLRPGDYSKISTEQLAYLGDGHYADGNVFNAIQYHDDPRSLVEVAIGGSGADTIIGNAANNILRGGQGADILTGGPGDDVFYFANSDFQAGVSKTITDLSWAVGNGEHDRIRIDGVHWTTVTATLAGAVTDLSLPEGGGKHADILIDGSNKAPLQIEFGAHPTGNLLSLETTSYANLTIGYFDVANVQPWSRHFDTYSAKGSLASELAFNDDGTSDTFHWDVWANHLWSEYTDHFTAAGRLQSQVNYNDNGTSDTFHWDVSGTQPWCEYTDHFTAAGRLQSQVNYNDNGTSDIFHWDVAGTQPWSEYTAHLGAGGHAQWQDVSYRNGTQAITGYANGLILSDPRVNDTYTGGGTNETFVFAPHFGKAVVTDFIATGAGHDTLELHHTVFADLAHLQGATHQVGHDTVITADAADTITLEHVMAGSLRATDFHFI